MVRHGRQVQGQTPGHRGVRIAGIDAAANEPCQVDRCQAVALLVLCDLGVRIPGAIPDHDRHFKQADALRGSPPLGAKVNLVPPRSIGGVNDDGLQDAVPPDVIRKLAELGLGDLGVRGLLASS